MNGRQFARKIADLGFRYERPGKGSHHIYTNGVIRLAVPLGKELDRRLERLLWLRAQGRGFCMRRPERMAG
jgi:predicted RNA binding protein YcfA (HicA-like mRNA interferase family)